MRYPFVLGSGKRSWSALLGPSLLLLAACEYQPDHALETEPVSRDGYGNLPGTCIEFDAFASGETVNVAYSTTGIGPVSVQGSASGSSGNAAMILDSGSPGTQADLGTPNALFGGPGQGDGGYGFYFNAEPLDKVLIVSADGDADDPLASTAADSKIDLDFSGMTSVTCYRVTLIDVDDTESGRARFYGTAGQELLDLPFTVTGNNGVAQLDFGSISGVQRVELALGGAVAIDRFCFQADTLPDPVDTLADGCTRTIGFWKNHTGFGPQDDKVSALLPIELGAHGGGQSLMVGDAATARDVLKQNVYGHPSNGVTKLYAQLLAAKLNVASGASDADIAAELVAADAFLALHAPEDWSSLDAAEQDGTLFWKDAFDAYNNGVIGPGHCGGGGVPTGNGNRASRGQSPH